MPGREDEGICFRPWPYGAKPVMARRDLPAAARASVGLCHTREEVDAIAAGLLKGLAVFGAGRP